MNGQDTSGQRQETKSRETRIDAERPRQSRKLAVALKYDRDQFPAPVVTATGKGLIAERILDLASEHRVLICTDPELAQMLSTLDLGQVIPPDLYRAVAEVFAFIHRLEVAKRRADKQRAPLRRRPAQTGPA